MGFDRFEEFADLVKNEVVETEHLEVGPLGGGSMQWSPVQS